MTSLKLVFVTAGGADVNKAEYDAFEIATKVVNLSDFCSLLRNSMKLPKNINDKFPIAKCFAEAS